MLDSIRKNIEKYKMVSEKETILAAVSGGPDSMAMLHCLYGLREEMGFDLVVAHVNHGVRGALALRDQMFTKDQSEKLGLEFYTTNVDMEGYGKAHGMTSEEAGRLLRYGFFREVLNGLGGGKIAVAHNKNDQAETVLHRIIRGTGLDGLRAMTMISGDIIRPLLDITRDEIERFIEENKIDTVEDHTNKETVYTRNKIRLELIPYIEDNFNPNIIDSLCRLSEIAQKDLQVIEEELGKKYNLVVKKIANNSIIFKGGIFSSENEGARRRFIRMAISHLVGDLNGFDEVHVASVIKLFESGVTGKIVNIPKGISAKVTYDDYIVEITSEASEKPEWVKLQEGENHLVQWGLVVEVAELKDCSESDISGRILVDRQKIKGDLVVRTRTPGDRIRPVGMEGSKKVKDIFIDNKIPRERRDKIPIFADEKGILWIPGHSISRDYKPDKGTLEVVSISIREL